jgi:hypothetical protein
VLAGEGGDRVELVWHVAAANPFGHDRRADRAAEAFLAYDDFAQIPDHVRALDVGAVCSDGELVSLRDARELYVISEYARGTVYAEDLRRIAASGATPRDADRAEDLAHYLARLHVPVPGPDRYRRAIRDLVGSGEGIFGIADNFPAGVPGAPLHRIHAIEHRCVEWRWRLREHDGRLCRTHGDFHPFNVVFDGDCLTLLDASRGACGDPADDVTAMAINYLLFALDAPRGWVGLGPLWHRFWQTYREARHDPSLCAIVPPFLAWRALVVCSPAFYPNLTAESRAALLGLVEGALDAGHFDPAWADEMFG